MIWFISKRKTKSTGDLQFALTPLLVQRLPPALGLVGWEVQIF